MDRAVQHESGDGFIMRQGVFTVREELLNPFCLLRIVGLRKHIGEAIWTLLECAQRVTTLDSDGHGLVDAGEPIKTKSFDLCDVHAHTIRRDLKILQDLGLIWLKRQQRGQIIRVNLCKLTGLSAPAIQDLFERLGQLSEEGMSDCWAEIQQIRSISKYLGQEEIERETPLIEATTCDKMILSTLDILHHLFESKVLNKIGTVAGKGWEWGWGCTNTDEGKKERGKDGHKLKFERVQNPIAEYLDFFRTEKMIEKGKPMLLSKEVRLLQELWQIVIGKAELDGEKIPCTVQDSMDAITETCNRDLNKPLYNHHYLKQVVLNYIYRRKKEMNPIRIMQYKGDKPRRKPGWYRRKTKWHVRRPEWYL